MEAFIIDPAKLIGDIVGECSLTLKTTQQMLRDPKKPSGNDSMIGIRHRTSIHANVANI